MVSRFMRWPMAPYLVLAVVMAGMLALNGCATPAPATGEPEAPTTEGGALGRLAVATADDVAEARRSAAAHGDALALVCWDYLARRIEQGGGVYITEVKGVASAYQKARNVRRVVAGGLSDEAKMACAPMLLDSAAALGRLAPLLGGAL